MNTKCDKMIIGGGGGQSPPPQKQKGKTDAIRPKINRPNSIFT